MAKSKTFIIIVSFLLLFVLGNFVTNFFIYKSHDFHGGDIIHPSFASIPNSLRDVKDISKLNYDCRLGWEKNKPSCNGGWYKNKYSKKYGIYDLFLEVASNPIMNEVVSMNEEIQEARKQPYNKEIKKIDAFKERDEKINTLKEKRDEFLDPYLVELETAVDNAKQEVLNDAIIRNRIVLTIRILFNLAFFLILVLLGIKSLRSIKGYKDLPSDNLKDEKRSVSIMISFFSISALIFMVLEDVRFTKSYHINYGLNLYLYLFFALFLIWLPLIYFWYKYFQVETKKPAKVFLISQYINLTLTTLFISSLYGVEVPIPTFVIAGPSVIWYVINLIVYFVMNRGR